MDDKNIWYPDVDGVRLKVRYRRVPQVEYDEEKFRARLGERYLAFRILMIKQRDMPQRLQ